MYTEIEVNGFETSEARKESEIERVFISACTRLGWEVRKAHWIGHAGAADRIVFAHGGVTGLVEVKRPRKGLDPLQEEEKAAMARVGHVVWVIKGEGDVLRFVADMQRRVGNAVSAKTIPAGG